jgi:putative DNA primase/helicase
MKSFKETLADYGMPEPFVKNYMYLRKVRWGEKRGEDHYWMFPFKGGVNFGDWRTRFSETWFERDLETLSVEERNTVRKAQQEAYQRQEADKKRSQANAAKRSKWAIENYPPCTAHPYADAKQFDIGNLVGTCFGNWEKWDSDQKKYVAISQDALIIPIFDPETDEISGMQGIYPTPQGDKPFTKMFPSGCKKGIFTIGDVSASNVIVIAEGVATGASIYEATGYAVLVAFDAGNMIAVAPIIRKKYPDAVILIAEDHDLPAKGKTEGEGQRASRKAAKACKGTVVKTGFTDKGDFNDLKVAQGLEAVRKRFETAMGGVEEMEDAMVMEEVAEKLERMVEENKQPFPNKEGFHLVEYVKGWRSGVYHVSVDERTRIYKHTYVCTPFDIIAIFQNVKGRGQGYLVEYKDNFGQVKQWAMPARLINKEQFAEYLLSEGVRIENSKLMGKYLQSKYPKRQVTCANKTGWLENGVSYILPDGTIIKNATVAEKEIIFQTETETTHGFSSKGTLPDWKNTVSRVCMKNSRLVFSLSASFAGPLLTLLNEESRGAHFVGSSSAGKSSGLKAAASVWGNKDFKGTWKATKNGMEGIAALLNDNIFLLDELGESDPKEIGEIIYMLFNERGKVRANIKGEAREPKVWRFSVLSGGEITPEQHMAKVGKKISAGQEVRLPSIPADIGEYGFFDTLHEFEKLQLTKKDKGATFAKYLSRSCYQNYGIAGPAFLRYLVDHPEEIENLDEKFEDFHLHFKEKANLPENADGQIYRVLAGFALNAFAGELATKWEITGWPTGHATWGAMVCFNDWLCLRGGVEASETIHLIKSIRLFVEMNQNQFQKIGGFRNADEISKRVGFVKTGSEGEVVEYIFLPEAFTSEVCKGHNPTTAIKFLTDQGILVKGDGKNVQKRVRLPELGNKRCYVLDAEKLEEWGVTKLKEQFDFMDNPMADMTEAELDRLYPLQ